MNTPNTPNTSNATSRAAGGGTPGIVVGFIGGGNMASAIVGGLVAQGMPAADIRVVEPFAEARARLADAFGVEARETPSEDHLAACDLVVWAVKPQNLREAAAAAAPFARDALHLSIAAGIPGDSIVRWTGARRVVRAMPNTPALIGQGITGLFACTPLEADDRQKIERVLAATGECLWVEREALLDAVTALSGSGPAYVFYFLEAMVASGIAMGLAPAQARQLAIRTFSGASALAAASADPLPELRARVTSKGGTTHAAIAVLEAEGMQQRFGKALEAARQRAQTMAAEFGRD
jgi:pyrroline-5-carboxylate reductase